MGSDDILVSLKQLQNEKVNGKLDENDDLLDEQKSWRNKLNYEDMGIYIKSPNEEIRLGILGLIVQSKKSTLRFTPKELEIILAFIQFNVGEAIDFIPLIKKAFKRMKESLAVFQRNVMQPDKLKAHKNKIGIDLDLYQKLEEEYNCLAKKSLEVINIYRAFIINVRDECLSGICCGATHTRKKNSLSILQLEQEILNDNLKKSPWNKEQAEKLFQCLLLDTYEANKEMAFEVISNIPPSTLKLDDTNVVNEIVNVALKLANGVRPIDSITALYMFKVCLMSPIISDILKNWDANDIQDPILQLINIILDHLQSPTKLANENIIAAVAKHSLYGYIFCINRLIMSYNFRKTKYHSSWLKTVAEIISISLSLNMAISVIVNNSSPEGHFPMDLERTLFNDNTNESELAIVTPQMVLLCSWRTVKEVSLLFGHLAMKCPIKDESLEPGLMTKDQIVNIGNHLVTLLSETKHRGAFEQAHVGFENLCSRLWRLEQKSLQQLPKIWLYELLLAITGTLPGNSKLCATRRSAGVPFMVQALIASEPSVKNKTGASIFHSVMKILLALVQLNDKSGLIINARRLILQEDFFTDLHEVAQGNYSADINIKKDSDKITLSEVKTHALNILRALFKHAQLGDLARAYAADGLIAAIKNYDEKTWAERNAATLLFSALITRIFGVQRSKDYMNLTIHNKMTGRIFFERYPKLLPFMLAELKSFSTKYDGIIRPSVQSILLLLSRLYVGVNSDNNTDVNWDNDDFVKLVSTCAKSRIYTTRELAARAIVPLLTEKTVCPFINNLFDSINTEANSSTVSRWNKMHGYMLQAFEITKSNLLMTCELSNINLERLMNNSPWIIENLSVDNNKPACFPLAAAYLDFLDEFMNLCKFKRVLPPYEAYYQVLMESVTYIINDRLKNRPGKEIFEIAAVKFIIKWGLVVNNEYALIHSQLLQIWKKILSHSNNQVQILGWTNFIGIIHSQDMVELKKELYDYAIDLAIKPSIQECNRKLQSAVYEFLYQVCIDSEQRDVNLLCINTMEVICNTILCSFVKNMPRTNASSLKLLGKSFGLLFRYNSFKSISLLIQHSNCRLYEIFLNYSWSSSADIECRLATASIIYDIYIDISYLKHNNSTTILLDWWTILLRLLVDDNFEVRSLASIAICKLEPQYHDNCTSHPLVQFFYKFSKIFHDNQCASFAAYFYWSLSLTGDDYQMDESDVFNKLHNYETYEPLRIAHYCEMYTKDLLQNQWNIDYNFCYSLRQWLNGKLDLQLNECATARTLITLYEKRLSVLNNNLYDLLDPMYNDKLLQILIFKKYTMLLNEHCDTSETYN